MSEPLHSGYQSQLSAFRLQYSRTGCMVSIVLVLGGVALDYVFYPEHLAGFMAARIVVSLLSAGALGLLYTRHAAERVRALTMLWLTLPQVMIAGMIFWTQGAASPYVFGLSLALYAAGIIMPIGFFQSISLGVFTCFVYAVACYAHPDSNWSGFVGNSIFLVFSAAISAGCTYFNERARLELFRLQQVETENNLKLQQTNQALADTNQALADVKGHMIQQEKMAALGTLSAGLLHEVNNPVNYSLMALNMALTEPEVATSPNLKESLVDAREGMQRVQKIVSDLKTFAYQKPGEGSDRVFLLEKAIESAQRLTGYELKGIEVKLDLPMDTHVRGDEPALIGVLINLLSNAALALHKAERAAPLIEVRAWADGDRLRVTVRDNGTGILPENLTRVFEPFFTTRDVGQGLGLGLSVSYGIIQRHGGVLTVTSAHGAWTEFAFSLLLAHQGA
jgi:two-component system, sensor histidine kinase PhcS